MKIEKGKTVYIGGKKFVGPCELPLKYEKMIEGTKHKETKKVKPGESA